MNLDNDKNMVKRAIKNEYKEVKAPPLVKSRNKKRILTKNQKSRMEKEKFEKIKHYGVKRKSGRYPWGMEKEEFEKAMVDKAIDRTIEKIKAGTVTADTIKTHNLKGENQ